MITDILWNVTQALHANEIIMKDGSPSYVGIRMVKFGSQTFSSSHKYHKFVFSAF